nr:uncharacterized protein LOC121126719 isoform X2 [Lepeophtheirus salmonis]
MMDCTEHSKIKLVRLIYIIVLTITQRPIPAEFTDNVCSIQNKCCNMAKNNCCTQGNCYTVWERICDSAIEDHQCQTVGKKVCIPMEVNSCRTVREKIFRNYIISHCAQSPLRKCFNYKKKICIAKEIVSTKNISWENEKLVLDNATAIKKCFDLNTVSCQTVWEIKKIPIPVKKNKTIPKVSNECKMQNIRETDKVIKVPVSMIINQKVCWIIPEVKCLNKRFPCSQNCPMGDSCHSLQFQQPLSICPSSYNGKIPTTRYMNNNCININPPICEESICKPYSPNNNQKDFNNQQCCRQKKKKICRQVPTRITKLMNKVIPGRVSYKKTCKNVINVITKYYWGHEMKIQNKSRNVCKPSLKNECVNITIRTYNIEYETKSNQVNIRLPVCEYKEVNSEFCHTFPEGNIICRNATVPKSFNLHKIKCDVKKQMNQCAIVPIVNCKNETLAGSCQLIPRVICPNRKECKSGEACNICEHFRRNIGFHKCQFNKCSNFVASDNWKDEKNANNFYRRFHNSFPSDYYQSKPWDYNKNIPSFQKTKTNQPMIASKYFTGNIEGPSVHNVIVTEDSDLFMDKSDLFKSKYKGTVYSIKPEGHQTYMNKNFDINFNIDKN